MLSFVPLKVHLHGRFPGEISHCDFPLVPKDTLEFMRHSHGQRGKHNANCDWEIGRVNDPLCLNVFIKIN